MTVEHACTRVVSKPWGSTDLLPWSDIQPDDVAIGELWFQRPDANAPASALLLKLLFTKEPLSIQVHPNDAFAHSIGLVNGKTEAWYVLSATPEAEVAVGLKRQLTTAELRASIEDGSIADLIQWSPARKGDVIFVPAGTIHAIGPGLVLAEIQQRSDTTFRLFDHGRRKVDARELIDHFSKGGRREARTATEIDRVFEIGRLLMRLACRPHRLKQHRGSAISKTLHQSGVE